MDQRKLNQAEWENPANWSGPKWLSVYFSKRDSRIWVPKQIPVMGWTVNLGRTGGVAWLMAIILAAWLSVVVIGILAAGH